MLAASRAGATGIPGSRDALRPDATRRTVVTQESAETGEVRLEGIEEREGFGRLHKIKIAAETDGVFVEGARDIVHQLKARLAVEVRVAAVHADRESIG